MYKLLSNWLDRVLQQEIPENVTAFCFNLYDDGDNNWSMELVGTESFDREDEDWGCDEITDFGTRQRNLAWNQPEEWDTVLQDMISTLNEYLDHGRYAKILKKSTGIGVGFVDGDLHIIFEK